MTEAEFTGRVTDMERKLYRVSFSILKNDADCKDAMQEATYRAWNNMPKLRDETRFEAWLTSILINECKDFKRSRARHPESELPEQIPAPEADNSVSEAIYSLNGKQRDSMALHYIEGYNVGEIAEMLDARPGTVKSWLHFGRKKLRTILIAVIIALLLIGAAIAISMYSSLLAQFFGDATPPDELQELVKYDVSHVGDKGVRLNIDEVVCDKTSLGVRWSVTSERDEPVIYYLSRFHVTEDYDMIGDGSISGPCGDGEMGVLGARAGGYDFGPTMYGSYTAVYGGVLPEKPVTVEVEITFYTTDLTPVLYDEDGAGYASIYIDPNDPYYEDIMRLTTENRQFPVSVRGYTYFGHFPEYVKALDELRAQVKALNSPSSQEKWDIHDSEEWQRANDMAYETSGLLKRLTTLTVKTTVDFNKSSACSYEGIDGRNEFEFSDMYMSIDELSFYPLSTQARFRFRPKGEMRKDPVLLLADENYDQIELLYFGDPELALSYQKLYGRWPATFDDVDEIVWTGNGDPLIKTPKYVNILLTDAETSGVDNWHYAVCVGTVYGKNGKKNIKYLFDEAPDCDKAVVLLAPRGADE